MTAALFTPAPEGGYVAHDSVTRTTTQGDDIAEALANLCEAVGLYLEEVLPQRSEPLGHHSH